MTDCSSLFVLGAGRVGGRPGVVCLLVNVRFCSVISRSVLTAAFIFNTCFAVGKPFQGVKGLADWQRCDCV